MTPRKRTLHGHLFSNSQEEDVIEEMTRMWMTNWNDYGVRDIVHTMKQWDSLVQLHAATLMCNIIIQEYEDDGSSAPAGLVDLRKRASTGLPFGSGLHDYVVTLLEWADNLGLRGRYGQLCMVMLDQAEKVEKVDTDNLALRQIMRLQQEQLQEVIPGHTQIQERKQEQRLGAAARLQ
ncbi:hypothetical protein NDU88_001390 [Pleurodeles waltl]|uniref:Uncharacterized protein n=1 Tax=Pleurodeles waltl TaxID=8319 RepID=A0AAV7V8A1_PLEWA|nr:hypothetical protein NDU88_001390 [Pleurodeles waltl]